MSETLLPYVVLFCRIAIGLTFIFSAFTKITEFGSFERALRNFNMIPNRWVRLTAVFILFGEATVVIGMINGAQLLVSGFFLAGLILVVFSIALISVLKKEIPISCNCFGPSDKMVSHYDVWRNLGLLLCACFGGYILFASGSIAGNFDIVEWVLIGTMSGTFVVLLLGLQEIVELVKELRQ